MTTAFRFGGRRNSRRLPSRCSGNERPFHSAFQKGEPRIHALDVILCRKVQAAITIMHRDLIIGRLKAW